MNRLIRHARVPVIGAAGLVLAGAFTLVVLPASIPDALVRDRVDDELARWTGNAVRLRHDARIAVRPGLLVRISQPVFVSSDSDPSGSGGGSGWRATASALEATLRAVPLLAGRVELAGITVVGPEISLAAGVGPLAAASYSPVETLPEAATRPAASWSASDIALVDGVLRLDDGADERGWISDLNLRLSSPADSGAVTVTASGVVGSHQLIADLRLDDPAALYSDAGTRGRLSVDVGPGPLAEDADLAERGLRDIGAGMRRVAMALGLPGLGPVVIDGRFALSDDAIEITQATFSTGGVSLDGHLRADLGRDAPLLFGLRSVYETGDAAIAAAAREMRDGQWSDAPITFPLPDDLDIDLGLSGEEIVIGTATLKTAALSLIVEDGSARLRLEGESESLGRLRTDLTVDGSAEDGPQLALRGRFDNVAVGAAAHLVAGMASRPIIGAPQLPTGTFSAEVDLATSGDTPRRILDAVSGSGTAVLTDGSLAGGDVITTLDSLAQGREFMTDEKGPLIPAAGRTRFDRIEIRMVFGGGTADVSRLNIAGERFEINMAGDVRLNGGAINADGHALLFNGPITTTAPTERPDEMTVDLPFGVGGTLFDPVIAAGVPLVDVGSAQGETGMTPSPQEVAD